MELSAEITGITYTPLMCKELGVFQLSDLEKALATTATFELEISSRDRLAVSWWVSAKRTRSYPYARVYDSLRFSGKKVTILPILKDEGIDGDRDFLQWDTVSLMSLLGVYVIIGYYHRAEKSRRYRHKITKQRFATSHVQDELIHLLSYRSDALHWNLQQIEKVEQISRSALDSYSSISRKLGVKMHSPTSAQRHIDQIFQSKECFIEQSRRAAKQAQRREIVTDQPKERVSGVKATVTIKNYLGGHYYFTCDEIEIVGDTAYLIEAKHSRTHSLPTISDVKDGLLKMMLFSNLTNAHVGKKQYNVSAVLKLTARDGINTSKLSSRQSQRLALLRLEAERNNFELRMM